MCIFSFDGQEIVQDFEDKQTAMRDILRTFLKVVMLETWALERYLTRLRYAGSNLTMVYEIETSTVMYYLPSGITSNFLDAKQNNKTFHDACMHVYD